MHEMLDGFFKLRENDTDVPTEAMGGLTTFLTMAYIIFVNPAVITGVMFGNPNGMDLGAVTVATCLSAFIATLIMGLWANYPIALAPGMGENFFFVFTVVPAAAALGVGVPWQIALGVVFVSGALFFILSVLKVREAIINAISPSMKNGIAVGIGLFIAFIGLKNAGVIVGNQGTLVQLTGNIRSSGVLPNLVIFAVGLTVAAVLHVWRVRGAILVGILVAALTALILRRTELTGVISMPPALKPTLFMMDLKNVFLHIKELWALILIFLFMDVFDTVGTLVGVGEQAGFMKDNRLPRASRALLADATGTVVGAAAGTSTVTSYIESATGVEYGARTGLAAVVTALLFLVAPFFSPLVETISHCPAVTAPALVIVGAMMIRNVTKIAWDDYSESVPAFLSMICIPLTFSISDGLAIGFVSYGVIKIISGRAEGRQWLSYVLAAAMLVYMVFLKG
jgi:AGZA family xanthine/uracil permease-like MFS transporter